jgi:putative peptide zinc metalloprotease protein
MHYAKLRGSTRYFRMGEREVFLLASMDGTRTPEQIQSAYAQHFHKRLSPTSWKAALQLFAQRGFLVSPHEADTPASQEGASPMGRESHGPFSFKLVHWDLDEGFAALVPWFRWFINGTVLSLLGLAALLCELILLRNLHAVWTTARSIAYPAPRAIAFLCTALVMMVLHECSHAIACKRYGGEVREVGLLVRYFMLCAYTRVDDILLFQRRRERVYVLLIGPLVGLAIIPFTFLLWLHTPPHALWHIIAADLLIWYNFVCLLQFLPFMKFDGYYVLAQIMKMPELRTDSYSYLIALGRHYLGRGERYAISAECAPYVRPACLFYGIVSFIATTLLMMWVLFNDVLSLRHWLGLPLFLVVVSVLAILFLWRLYTQVFPNWRPNHSDGASYV